MNKKMTAAVLYGKKNIKIEKISIPEVGPGDILIKIKTALTCGTDLKVYKRGYHSKMIQPPAVFGHEFSGIVEKIGNQVKSFEPGNRVVAANSAPCDQCFYCQKGQPNLCNDLLFINGAYAEYMLIPKRVVQKNMLKLEDQLSFKEAALTEPLACAIKGIEDTGLDSGDFLLILGTGPLSLMFVELAKIKGAQVWILGRSSEKLAVASKLGADQTINMTELKDPLNEIRNITPDQRGPDFVIDATGVPECWELSIGLVRKGGVVNLFGGCPSGTKISIHTEAMHYQQLTLKASFHHTPKYIKESLKLITSGKIHTDIMIQQEKPLTDLPEIFSSLAGKLEPKLDYSPKTAIIP